MATVRFVKPEHVAIMRDYLGSNDGGAVVLIYPEMQEAVAAQGVDDEDDVDYDFGGGDSDLQIDVIASKEHYFMGEISQTDDE